MNKVEKYIAEGWNECIKFNKEDNGTLIGLPYPYTVPAVGTFDEIYYWDTYFTNLGLIISGMEEQAKYNVDNMLYMVEKFGFMLNGNRTYYLNRSQPPFLSEMVHDIYRVYRNKEWLSSAYNTLKKEYNFWMTERNTPTGLNVYGGFLEEKDIKKIAGDFRYRTKSNPPYSDNDVAKHSIATWESGWDINPRWGYEAFNFNPVDLNSLIYLFEVNMKEFAETLNLNDEKSEWEKKSVERKNKMHELLTDENGLFWDYNFANDTLSPIFSVASYYTMYAGLATKEQAEILVKNLSRLEMQYGVSTCEKNSCTDIYQWDYPNGWACLQYVIVKGLLNYGFEEDAKRIADKYIRLTEKVFDETGNLWEKYNVEYGNINVTNEYEMPAMMGWSAGIYLALKNI